MRTIKAISLLTAAVMGCTALLAGCGKGSDSSSSKAEDGAKASDDGSIIKTLPQPSLQDFWATAQTLETPWKPTATKAIPQTPTLKALKLSGGSLSQRRNDKGHESKRL